MRRRIIYPVNCHHTDLHRLLRFDWFIGEKMEQKMLLGKSSLRVPRMGVGAMTWGDAKGLARLHPAKTAYGGAEGFEEEKRALEVSIAAGANLFDTAAFYSGGASEQRVGELVQGQEALVASKFPGGFSFRAE